MVYHTKHELRYRLCKETSKTIQHRVAGCKMQAGTTYTEQHNQVAVTVYKIICTVYGLDPPKPRWEVPQKVMENNKTGRY